MLRSFRLDPQAFLEILHLGQCVLGSRSHQLQAVRNPSRPGRITVVRLDQDVTGDEIETHLLNLDLPASQFLAWHTRYMALIRE